MPDVAASPEKALPASLTKASLAVEESSDEQKLGHSLAVGVSEPLLGCDGWARVIGPKVECLVS